MGDGAEILRRGEAPFGDCRHLRLDGGVADGRVAIVLAIVQASEEDIGGVLTFRGLREEQEMLGVLALSASIGKGLLQHRADILDAFATGRAGAGEDELAHQFGAGLDDQLADEAAHREAEQVDLGQAEGFDEGDRVLCHVVNIVGRFAAGAADAAIVENDDMVFAGEAIDNAGIPVVEHGRQMIKQQQRNATLLPEFAIGEGGAIYICLLGRRIFKGRCHFTLNWWRG